MQQLNWNDYRILLAVARAETLAGAADVLGLNPTTVSRRIKAIEAIAKADLVSRAVTGQLQLSPLGRALADLAEKMERHAQASEAMIGQYAPLSGTVRLTAVPFLLNRLIVPQMAGLIARHPQLRVSLIPDSQNLSLTRREVDLAIRFAAPRDGGAAVIAQKIASLSFSVFTLKDAPQSKPRDRPWITYDPVAAHLPQAVWTNDLAQAKGATTSPLLMHDLEAVYQAVLAIPSRALLPTCVARQDPRLVELPELTGSATLTRDVWLLRNKDMRGVARIDAVVTWLTKANLFG